MYTCCYESSRVVHIQIMSAKSSNLLHVNGSQAPVHPEPKYISRKIPPGIQPYSYSQPQATSCSVRPYSVLHLPDLIDLTFCRNNPLWIVAGTKKASKKKSAVPYSSLPPVFALIEPVAITSIHPLGNIKHYILHHSLPEDVFTPNQPRISTDNGTTRPASASNRSGFLSFHCKLR